jgi:hypothetical protein
VAALAAVLALVMMSAGGVQAGEKRCKGTKQFYAGKCRYPDEVAQLRAEAQKQAQQSQQEQAARARAEEEARRREERRVADAKACVTARKQESREAWQGYLDAFPEGLCVEEANKAMALVDTRPEPEPEPEPQPEPEPDANADGQGLWLGQSPLVWIGFGVAAAGAITWGVAGGISMARASDLEETCPNNRCAPENEGDLDAANTAAHVTTVGVVLTVVGTAVGVTGLLLPLLSDDPGEAEVEVASLRLRPVVTLGSVGLAGAF